MFNRYVFDAIDTDILLISVETFAEYESVIFRSKFDRYISVVNVVTVGWVKERNPTS